jgi:hypothetical protein
MFVLQRVVYGKQGSYVVVNQFGGGIGFDTAHDLNEATKFPTSLDVNAALLQRAATYPEFSHEDFQTVEVAKQAALVVVRVL